jgi:hypothetical protein
MKLSQRILIATLALAIMVGLLAVPVRSAAPQTTPLGHSASAITRQQDANYRVYLPLILKPSLFQNVANGDRVAQTITLIGTYPLTLTDDLWVFVVPPNNLYYPQSLNACAKERTPKVNGKWEMRVGFGGPNNVGENFEILLTAAIPSASQLILDTLKRWCDAQNYPGFETLPAGVRVLDRITVTRTADRWGPAPRISNDMLPGIVTITSPIDRAEVNQEEIVKGTYTSDVVNDIWLLIYPPNGRWYPQSYDACRGDHVHKSNGRWDVRVTFGQPSNVGEPFDVVVILADANASHALDLKQREWCMKDDYRGWLTIELPQKIDEKAQIRVFRK